MVFSTEAVGVRRCFGDRDDNSCLRGHGLCALCMGWEIDIGDSNCAPIIAAGVWSGEKERPLILLTSKQFLFSGPSMRKMALVVVVDGRGAN